MHKVLCPVLQKVHFAPQVRHLRDGFNVMCDFPFRKALRSLRNLRVDPLSLHTSMRNKQLEFNPLMNVFLSVYNLQPITGVEELTYNLGSVVVF